MSSVALCSSLSGFSEHVTFGRDDGGPVDVQHLVAVDCETQIDWGATGRTVQKTQSSFAYRMRPSCDT